jgi:hypothetical protein
MKSKKRKLKSIHKKIADIESKFPDVNFRDRELVSAFRNHEELVKQSIYLTVDIEFCESDNHKEMCSECDCWKAVAVFA